MSAIIALHNLRNNGLSFYLRKLLKMLRNNQIVLANLCMRYHNEIEKVAHVAQKTKRKMRKKWIKKCVVA